MKRIEIKITDSITGNVATGEVSMEMITQMREKFGMDSLTLMVNEIAAQLDKDNTK
jgi:hypothetical protein